MRKTISVVIALAAVVALGTSAFAAGPGGGGGFGVGSSGGGFGGFTGSPPISSVPGLTIGNMMVNNPPAAPQRFRELNIAGRVPADPARLPVNARIVTLRVNGQLIPMALDAEAFRGELRFDPSYDYGRELYHSVTTKPIEVVGDANLRTQIAEAAANPARAKPIQIDGYVFDRMSPYLVLRSVAVAQ